MSLTIRIGRFRFGPAESPPARTEPPFTVPHPSFARTRTAMEALGERLSIEGAAYVEAANRDHDARVATVLGRAPHQDAGRARGARDEDRMNTMDMDTGGKSMNDIRQDTTLRSIVEAVLRQEKRPDMVALLVYLVDWRHVLTSGRQATSIDWRIDLRGPRASGLMDMVREMRDAPRPFLSSLLPRTIASMPGITPDIRAAIQHVLAMDGRGRASRLIQVVHSTWPVFNASAEAAWTTCDLVGKAEAYREAMPEGEWPNAVAA